MAPRSLAEMCVRVAIVNVNLITGFGDLPVNDNMREILRAVRTAEHLRSIELGTSDPHIYEETEPIWKRLIQRKFFMLQRENNWAPDKPENWHKVWDRYQQTSDAAQANAIAMLQAAVAANNEKKESNKATIVNASELRGLGAKEPRKTTHWSAQQPKKPNKTFIQKARNQVRQEVSRFRPANAPRNLPVGLGKVERAPESMINDKRIEQQYNPHKRIATAQQVIRAPQSRPSSNPESLGADRERKEREARLLRIKGGSTKGGADKNSPPPPTILQFDDDDNLASGTSGQNDGFDDLFGNEPPSPKIRSSTNPRKAKSSLRDYDDLFGDEPPSPKIKLSTNSGKAKSSLLDIDSIESLHTESSGSSSARSNSTSSRPSIAGPPADRRRGGLLSAAPGTGKTPVRISHITKSPPAVGKSTATTSPPASGHSGNPVGSFNASRVAHKTLSSMTAEDAQNIEFNIPVTSPGPSGAPQPRRIIKRKPSVSCLVPNKRARK
ncbi:hypothetical protein V8F06_000247 [Rhypophila decipiens]